MREVEFLPGWYPKVRQRKRIVAFQAWVTLILIIGLGLWMILVQRNVYAKQQELGSLQTDLYRSEEEVHHLDQALALQQALSGKNEIIDKIGTPVEMSKVMTTLDTVMPANMALVELTLDTEEAPKSSGNTLAARAAAEQKREDSKLHFKLHGVSPTDVDLAEFLSKLTGKPFFKQVELLYSHEKVDSGHVMRDFEVAFAMELDNPAAAAPVTKKTQGAH
jgi:hypothetical protein